MNKKAISTTKAPAAIGPYSQAIQTGDLLFISGQLPLDPETGAMVEADIGARTHQIMKNIKAIVDEAGANLNKVVKTTIFLTDLSDFQEVNQAYGEHFEDTPPARSTVQVAALSLGSNIEIESIISLT